jgi:hypothetical protein
MRLALLASALVLLVACEAARPPMTRAQIAGLADALCVREGREWGEATSVLQPDAPDAEGKTWWQVRYADDANGAPRVILVDGVSRWARFAHVGEAVRVDPQATESGWKDRRLARGSWVLQLSAAPAPESERAKLEAEVATLNADALRSDLCPAFAVRSARDGLTITWGWQDDHGTLRDDAARDWVTRRTTYREPRWIDLAP